MVITPPTHNREPYDTQLSDTISTDPSVEPMPLSSTRFMRMSVCGVRAPPHGPRAPSRARLRAVGQAPRAGLVLVEVGVRHVERHSRLRSPDELAALHALLNDGSRHADVRHAADVRRPANSWADDEAQSPAGAARRR